MDEELSCLCLKYFPEKTALLLVRILVNIIVILCYHIFTKRLDSKRESYTSVRFKESKFFFKACGDLCE